MIADGHGWENLVGNSDSATTQRQKLAAQAELVGLGMPVPQWFADGASLTQVRLLLRTAREAKARAGS